MNHPRLTRYFYFLDQLRAAGSINMYGAASPLYAEFDDIPSLTTARVICKQWREKFNEMQTPAERAAQVSIKATKWHCAP